jgi:hypothetical protein
MEPVSLEEALNSCSNSCGWCVHQCPDKDKYEMLIYCIRIQKEFISVGKMTRLILNDKADKFNKEIFKLFEVIANDFQERDPMIKKNNSRGKNLMDVSKLPGCSQIFLVAQSIQQTVLNKLNYD